ATAGSGSQVYGDFSFSYNTAFGVDPATASFVANTFDAAMLVAVGAAWADAHGGLSGENIAQGLTLVSAPDAGLSFLEPSNFTTITGEFTLGHQVNIEGASGHLDFDS